MGETLPTPGNLVSDQLKAVFKTKMYELMSDLGRPIKVHLKPSVIDCPNCFWDHIKKKSKNKYDSSNTNTTGGPLHKPFLDGQICPVCSGRGILNTPRNVTYTALVSSKMSPDEIDQGSKFHVGVLKTTTHIDSFQDMAQAVSMSLDGYTYRRIAKPKQTGLQARIMVRTYWELVE